MFARIAILACSLALVPACDTTTMAPGSSAGFNAPSPDNISRNITATEGGSLHDPPGLSPPPIRPDFVEDR